MNTATKIAIGAVGAYAGIGLASYMLSNPRRIGDLPKRILPGPLSLMAGITERM